MLKFRLERKDGMGTLIGFGLSRENVERLMQGKPIMFPGEEVGMPRFTFCIVGGENEEAIAKEYHLERFLPQPISMMLRCPECGTHAEYEPPHDGVHRTIGPGAVVVCVGCLAFLGVDEACKLYLLTPEIIADMDATLRGDLVHTREKMRREKNGG